jgi:hypothetical protein
MTITVAALSLFPAGPAFPYVLHRLNRFLELLQIDLGIVRRKAKGLPNLETLNATNSHDLFGKLLDRAATVVIAVGGLPLAIDQRLGDGKQFVRSHVLGTPPLRWRRDTA